MTDYLIKSTIAMVVLLVIYHFFLEREKMHHFNRIYLLVALAFSLVLPFITVTLYKEVVTPEPDLVIAPMPMPQFNNAGPIATPVNYTPYIVLGIYLAITMVFAFRFVKNLLRFKSIIATNTAIQYNSATLVLMADKVLPHTFLNYIFINKDEYENRLIEEELFTHELTHVQQKHTFDILFMETLLMVFWFNPVLYFYKNAIKLNHEFLADENVVAQTYNVSNYQRLLLQKAVPATQYCLASSLNFSVTKKRFTMMTKSTPKSKAIVLKFIAVPVIAGLIFILCTETVARTKAATTQKVEEQNKSNEDIERDVYFAGVRVRVFNSDKVKLLYKPYEEFTKAEKNKYLPPLPKPLPKNPPTVKEFQYLKNTNKYLITINLKDVDSKELNKYHADDFAVYVNDPLLNKIMGKESSKKDRVVLLTNAFYEKNIMHPSKKFDYETCNVVMIADSKTQQTKPEMVPDHLGISQYLETRKKLQADNAVKRDSIKAQSTQFKAIAAQRSQPKVPSIHQEDIIYSASMVTIQPQYPGEMEAFYSDIKNELKVPKGLTKPARVYVSFVIEKDGSISNLKIVKDASGLNLGEETIRALKKTKNWLPAQLENKIVRCSYNLPISFNPER